MILGDVATVRRVSSTIAGAGLAIFFIRVDGLNSRMYRVGMKL
jgi:hypothetical protein